MRPPKRSRERGLFKECRHLSWDRCECPWLGRVRHERRVNLAKWAGLGQRLLTRSRAIDILAEVRSAVLKREFDLAGKAATCASGERTFSDLLDDFINQYVKAQRADGKLRGTSLDCYLERFRGEFGQDRIGLLEQSPQRFQHWLDALTFTTGPDDHRVTHKLSPASWNRY
jgi:hypothetical protein